MKTEGLEHVVPKSPRSLSLGADLDAIKSKRLISNQYTEIDTE